MTYTHPTTEELVMIEAYFHKNVSVLNIVTYVGRSRQTIHNVITFFEKGHTALNYFKQYKENKKRCGRQSISLPYDQKEYIQKKVSQGWTPDAIIGLIERDIFCSLSTLYRQFRKGVFDQTILPMKGKCKPNGHKEKCGRKAFKRNIVERLDDYPHFKEESGHLEDDTIVGVHHKSAVITLVERLSKSIITLKPNGHKAQDIEVAVNNWFQFIPKISSNPSCLFVEKNFLTGKPAVIKMMSLFIFQTQEHRPKEC